MSRQLFKSLLNYEFYNHFQHKIIDQFFPDELNSLFKTLKIAHDKYKKDLSVPELRDVHLALHPVMSNSQRMVLDEFIEQLVKDPDYNPDIAKDILSKAWKQEMARRIMESACHVVEGKAEDFNDVRDILELSLKDITDDSINKDFTLDELETLLANASNENNWKFNIESLQEATGGLPPGSFGIVAARPEVGKTAFYVSLVNAPGGFMEQEAKVHIWSNEEAHGFVLTRSICSTLNVTKHEVLLKLSLIKEKWKVNKPTIIKHEFTANANLADIEAYVAENEGNIDILVIDQLDKILVNDQLPSTDRHLLRTLYIRIRALAKRYNCAIMAITQAGSGADGKLYFNYNELDESKTAKAAEADYIFCIGMQTPEAGQEDTGFRVLNLAKNKLAGPRKPIRYVLHHDVTRCIG